MKFACHRIRIVFLFAGIALLSSASLGQAAILLSRSIGPPTSQTFVSGQGFPPDEKVGIYFDNRKVGGATTDGTGSFSQALVRVPKSAQPGKHWVLAKTQGGVEAKTHFLVRTNWPQYGFRPNGGRHNRFENVLTPANVGGLKVRFDYSAPSPLGGPVVAGGLLFFSAGDGNLYALNANTGVLQWKAEGRNPSVANKIVYSLGTGSDFFLYARNRETGAQVWSYNIGIPAFTPVVSGGVVYVTASTTAGYDLFALNANNGFLYWRTFIWNTPALGSAAVAGGTIVVGASGSSGSDLLAISNGSILWQYPITVASAPAVVHGTVYVGSTDDTLYAVTAANGTLLWKYATTGSLVTSPAVADGMVFIGSEDGSVYAVGESTGALIWKQSVGTFAASPAVANGVVYVASDEGNGYFLNALDAKTGASLFRYSLASPPTDPVIADGVVYFCTSDGHLYALGLSQSGLRATSATVHPRRR